jgi:hypothetical protein
VNGERYESSMSLTGRRQNEESFYARNDYRIGNGDSWFRCEIGSSKRRKLQTDGRVTEGFQVSANAEQEFVKLGTPVRLRIWIKNVTKQALYLAEAATEKDYSVQISSDTGKDSSY